MLFRVFVEKTDLFTLRNHLNRMISIRIMKRKIYTLPFLALLLTTLVFFGCKKDEIPPVITILGDADMEIALNATYEDDGATALDDEDGDLTSAIVVTNNVDPAVPGNYSVVYSATDEAGNQGQATRNVSVSVMQSNFIGLWSESDDCSAAVTPNDNPNFVAGSTDNAFVIVDFLDFFAGNLTVNFDGFDLTVPTQTLGGLVTADVTGTGTLSSDGTQVTLSMTFSTAIGAETCTLTYTKF